MLAQLPGHASNIASEFVAATVPQSAEATAHRRHCDPDQNTLAPGHHRMGARRSGHIQLGYIA